MTIEHLLSHRSGIGDYLDEDAEHDIGDYVMPVPVHELATTEQYLVVLDGHPAKFEPGTGFSYCNGGFVVLALIAERASGVPFHDLVHQRVCEPAGMSDTAFLRTDELPGRAALGYLEVDGVKRSNVFHFPVRGNGDGGIYTTVGDVRRALDVVLRWTHRSRGLGRRDGAAAQCYVGRRSATASGFWLAGSGDAVRLEGYGRGRVVPQLAPPDVVTHLHRHLRTPPTVRGPWRALSARLSS